MEELSHKRGKRRRRTPHVPRALQCSLLHGLVETKYPHVDTMKALGIFEDVELVSRTCTWPSSSLITWNPTRSSLASSSFNEAAWRSCLGSTMEKGTKWNFKEKELQRVWATIADGVYSSSRSKAAQIRSPVLSMCTRHLPTPSLQGRHRDNQRGELKFLDMGIKPILSRTSDGKRIRGDRSDTGNLMPFLDQLLPTRSQPTTLASRGRR
ncbi:unnamed protein product [Microthlaspi erraticum]|uniref:Arabidopsis retrotransposon Orf1 C-terminal domain-containing protein n=1 Tax=Microthlaspi erraticum TaxID=1685480 RepID=A0A6D2HQE0_9BRAS|nr:unnamed protein product [Microthlaspi erraticum]